MPTLRVPTVKHMPALLFPATLVALVTATGCSSMQESLRFESETRSPYAWKVEAPVTAAADDTTVVFVVLGGTLERRRDAPDPQALRIAAAARRICGDGCDFSVVTGNALASGGLKTEEDLTLLKRLVAAYTFAGPQFHVLGSQVGDTAHRVLHALSGWRHSHQTRGLAHFWRAGLARLGHMWGLDTDYLRHRSFSPRLRALTALEHRAGWRIVVGHHGHTSLAATGPLADLTISGDRPGASLQKGLLNVGPRGGFARVTVKADSLLVEVFEVDAQSSTTRRVAVARKSQPRAAWQSLAVR